MARALQLALADAGVSTTLASELRTRDGKGDPTRQAELIGLAEVEFAQVAKWRAFRQFMRDLDRDAIDFQWRDGPLRLSVLPG